MAKILGVYPFKINNKRLVYSKPRLLQTFIFLGIYLYSFLICYEKFDQRLPLDFKKIQTVIDVLKIRRTGNVLAMLLTVVTFCTTGINLSPLRQDLGS
jgi:hypothetical protein